ncbi:MAG TPA: tetratricopeptide repeat protein [Terriglobia bacterium]|nr:tetratricopeptide repeat protein [Terriglobia bacterium]
MAAYSSHQADAAPGARAGETAEAHLGAGYEDLRNNRYAEAAREFRSALELDPKLTMQARFPLAVSLFELHQADEARREFEAVRRATGDQPGVDYYLGRLDLAAGDLDGAVRELSKAAPQPPFPDTAYYLGSAYLKQRDYVRAEKWLRQAADLAPGDASPEYALGQLYSATGRKQDAARAYARSERLRQRQANVDRLRVDCTQKLAQGTLDEARAVCDRLYDAGDFEKLTILGTLYGQHGDYAEALKPLERAAELNPKLPQTQYNLALNDVRLNRYADARQPLAQAVGRWPDLFPLVSLYGVVLGKLGEDRDAYQALEHAHRLNPQDAATADALYEVEVRLAEASRAARQYAEALDYLRQAAELRPDSPEPHRLEAEVYDATGRTAEAAEERQRLERLTSR